MIIATNGVVCFILFHLIAQMFVNSEHLSCKQPTTHFKENNTGFFEKQKSFGRRCGGTVAMRPQSYDFSASVFKLHRSSPSRPNFSKLFLHFFNTKTCSKTSANLFAPPITSSRAMAVQTKSSSFDSNMVVWRPSWPNFQKLFFFFLPFNIP